MLPSNLGVAALSSSPTLASVPAFNTLRLILVALDSGKPVPNVQIAYRGWENKNLKEENFTPTAWGSVISTFLKPSQNWS